MYCSIIAVSYFYSDVMRDIFSISITRTDVCSAFNAICIPSLHWPIYLKRIGKLREKRQSLRKDHCYIKTFGLSVTRQCNGDGNGGDDDGNGDDYTICDAKS